MVDAFGGRRNNVKPPERGIFPLDHESQCKEGMKAYLECLKTNNYDHIECRALSKNYLQCRMDNDLMLKEDLSNLGLGDDLKSRHYNVRVDSSQALKDREKSGYLAGLDVRPSKSWFIGKS